MNIPNPLSSSGTVVLWADSIQSNERLTPLVSTIRTQGYELKIVDNAYQAIKNIIDKQAALLVVYLRAAGDKGYELCEILRSQSANQFLPVIFVGYRDNASERIKVLRCGGNDYLKLPINPEEGWLRLKQHLNMAQRVQQLETDRNSLSQKVSEYSRILKQQEQLKVSLAKENQALQKLAFVDGLTQVANRRSFNQSISQLWKEAAQKRQPLSLLLCDIDYFKRYNDTYGHLEGDRCLQSVAAALLRGASRFQDHVARYGGEEFAILLPETDSEGAQQVASTIQSELLQIQAPHESSLVAPWVTLSVGICTMLPETETQPHESLIHGADEAMYTAKIRGRNRSVLNTLTELISIEQNYCLCDYRTPIHELKKYWNIRAQTSEPVEDELVEVGRTARSQTEQQHPLLDHSVTPQPEADQLISEPILSTENKPAIPRKTSKEIAAELSRKFLPRRLSHDSAMQTKMS